MTADETKLELMDEERKLDIVLILLQEVVVHKGPAVEAGPNCYFFFTFTFTLGIFLPAASRLANAEPAEGGEPASQSGHL